MCNSGKVYGYAKRLKSQCHGKKEALRTTCLDIILTSFTELAIMPYSKLLIKTRPGLDPWNVPSSSAIYITVPFNTMQSLKFKTYLL